MDLTLSLSGSFAAARDEGESDPLRPLDWTALLARLGAERDLRRELVRNLGTPRAVADFGHGAALVLGDPSHGVPHNAPSVNPDALAGCKSTRGNRVAVGPNGTAAQLGARGQQ